MVNILYILGLLCGIVLGLSIANHNNRRDDNLILDKVGRSRFLSTIGEFDTVPINIKLYTGSEYYKSQSNNKGSRTLGYHGYKEGGEVIGINISYSYRDIAHTLIHEVAHAKYNTYDHEAIGHDLPIPEHSSHTEKNNVSEKIALWFEEYVFNNSKLKKDNPDVWEKMNEIVNIEEPQ